MFPLDIALSVFTKLECFPLPIHEDQVLDIGIIFSISMVKECSKHQIFLCYH